MVTWFVCAFGYTLWRGVVVWQAPYLLVVSGQVMAVPYWQMAGVIVAYQVTTLPLLYLLLRQLVAVIEDAGLLGVIVCGLSFCRCSWLMRGGSTTCQRGVYWHFRD